MPKTVLGFDFGLKHIGVAVGQTVTGSANPLTVLKAKQGIPNWQELAKLIQTWHPDALVVGRPLNMDGTPQPISEAAHRFVEQLRTHYSLPVYEVDERLTTVAAKENLFSEGGYRALSKQAIDSTSAQVILLDWLSHEGRGKHA